MKTAKIYRCFTLYSIFILIYVSFGCEVEDNTSSQDVDVSSKKLNVPVDDYKEHLIENMPIWNEDINSTSNVLTVDDASRRPFNNEKIALDTARIFNDENLVLSEKRSNSFVVYRNSDDTKILKYSDQHGYWKFVTRFDSSASKNLAYPALSDEDAHEKTEELFRDLTLPEQEKGDYVAVGIGEAGATEDGDLIPPKVIARHVRIFRKVNNIRVLDSHLMATYDLSGKPFRIKLVRPKINLDE